MSFSNTDLSNFKYNEDDKFKNLNSQKIHKALKKDVNGTNYDKYCPDTNLDETGKNDVKNICKKFIFSLNELLNIDDIGKNTIERCLNVKYWIYAELIKLLNKNSSSNNRESLIKYFSNAETKIYYELITSKYACPVEINKDINEWKEKVLLYDYFKNYYSLINWNNSSDKEECENYSAYVNSIIPHYERVKNSDCCGTKYLDCNDYFKCEKEYNPKRILKKIRCNGEQTEDSTETTAVKDEIENDASTPFSDLKFHLFSCVVIQKKEGEKGEIRSCVVRPLYKYTYPSAVESGITDSTPAEGSVNGTDEVVDVSGKVAVSTSVNEGEKDCKARNLVMGANGKCEEPDVRRNGIIGFKVENSEPIKRVIFHQNRFNKLFPNYKDNVLKDTMFRSVTVGGLLVGVLLILFVYYKFTPLGDRMRKKLRGNKRATLNHVEHLVQTPLPHKAPSGNVNARKKRINIVYQSTGV